MDFVWMFFLFPFCFIHDVNRRDAVKREPVVSRGLVGGATRIVVTSMRPVVIQTGSKKCAQSEVVCAGLCKRRFFQVSLIVRIGTARDGFSGGKSFPRARRVSRIIAIGMETSSWNLTAEKQGFFRAGNRRGKVKADSKSEGRRGDQSRPYFFSLLKYV
ncbi:MAG: hypothetical protein ABIK07_11800, partial [Planctomycetota bacterium]